VTRNSKIQFSEPQQRGRLTVEKLSDIDVRELHRAGAFREGNWSFPWAGLRWPGIVRLRTSQYGIEVELRGRSIPQQIQIGWTRCYYGGVRPWLSCPHCRRRVAKLFRGLGGYYCRPCLGNPIYASQSKSTKGRRHFEACKLRLRLNGIASLAAPIPERPKRMHRKTYARLRRKLEKLEAGLSARFKSKPADYPNLVYYLSP